MNSMSHTKTSFKRITAILLCLVSIFALASCGSVQMEQKQIFAMDTVMTLTPASAAMSLIVAKVNVSLMFIVIPDHRG